jgi:predicted Zn-dependent protease
MYVMAHYEELLELDPRSEVFAFFAEELCSQKSWAEAVRICRQGLIFHPLHIRGRMLLGWALKELGEGDQAEKVLMEAAEEIRKNALTFSLLAEIADKAGKVERAETFKDIFQSLQAMAAEQQAAPVEAKRVSKPARESQRPGKVTFLSSLLERFEAKPSKTVVNQQVFSAEDRAQLTQILKLRRR